MAKKSDDKALFDLLNSGLAAQSYVKNLTHQEFIERPIVQDALAMRLTAMGENTEQLSKSQSAHLAAIPFGKIRAVRNIIAHSYEDVNMRVLWDIAQNHLPALIKSLTDHLALNTDFEKITAKLHASPTIEFLAQAHRSNSTLNVIINRAIELNIASAVELKMAIDSFDAAKDLPHKRPDVDPEV